MQPARFRQEDFLLVEINNAESTRPAVSSGEERGLLSRTAAGVEPNLHPTTTLFPHVSRGPIAAHNPLQWNLY